MASELRVNTLKDAAGNNSIATSFVAGGSAKAWVNFNGTGTIAARDSFNLSSLTDSGTGLYVVNHTANMVNDDYSVTSGGSRDDPESSRCFPQNLYTFATGSYKIATHNDGSTAVDWTIITQNLQGDLA